MIVFETPQLPLKINGSFSAAKDSPNHANRKSHWHAAFHDVSEEDQEIRNKWQATRGSMKANVILPRIFPFHESCLFQRGPRARIEAKWNLLSSHTASSIPHLVSLQPQQPHFPVKQATHGKFDIGVLRWHRLSARHEHRQRDRTVEFFKGLAISIWWEACRPQNPPALLGGCAPQAPCKVQLPQPKYVSDSSGNLLYKGDEDFCLIRT